MRTLLLISAITMLAILTAAGQEQTVHISGKLLDERGSPISGEIFLDTALNNMMMLMQDFSSPPRSSFEEGNVLIPVGENGTFILALNPVKPCYIHFLSSGKRSTSIFFPQTAVKQITLTATLFDERVKDDSDPTVQTNDPLINLFIQAFSLSNPSANTAVSRQMDASINWKIKNGTLEGFKFDLGTYYNKMLDIYSKTDNRNLKNYVLLKLAFLCVGDKYPVEEKYLKEVVENTPADDYIWSADKFSTHGVFLGLGGFKRNKDFLIPFVDSIAARGRSKSLRIMMLYNAMADAHNGQMPEFYTYYNRLVKEYPESSVTKNAIRRFGSNKVIEGAVIPDFSIINADNPGDLITPETLKGKVWIIDFWATWCGPCVKQLPYVEAVYNKYKDKGLGVLSVSVDADIEAVNIFRAKRYKMPWLNGFAGVKSAIAASFEVFAVPKVILIDKEGKVITVTQHELEGEMLEKTVAKHLNR